MSADDRSVLVAYASETGNAHDMADEAGRLCQRLHFRSLVDELNAIDLDTLLRHRLVVFVVSTTGQGDMPHNALLFWRRLLRRKLPPRCLARLRYACLGLGDSTYIKFNWAARKLTRRLDQLGATAFMDPCEADEQFPDGVEGAFAQWAASLRSHLLQHHPLPDGLAPVPEEQMLPPRWCLQPALSLLSNGHTIPTSDSARLDPPPVRPLPQESLLPVPGAWSATLASSNRLTPQSHWQDVRLVTFDIPSRPISDGSDHQQLQCHPGDCLTIYPKNEPQDAQKLISLMAWDRIADWPLNLSACPSLPRHLHARDGCSLRALLLNNVDITAIPRRSFLKSISYFTSNPAHRERLLEFTETQHLDEYFDYATRSRRTILEVLEEFTSVHIPASRLLDVFPLIRGRDFSVANGGRHLHHPDDAHVTRVELLVALVRYRTVLRKPREGLCSRYLASLAPGCTINVTRKPVLSPIHGPDNARRPLVAMATGTGLAPVRCLIQERLTHPCTAPMLLFFGNRNRAADYFFQDQWESLAASNRISLFTAFSRDQRHKIYVQDRVREQAPTIAALFPQRPIFSVCGGSSKMADACKKAVFDPVIGAEVGTEEEVEERRRRALAHVTWWQEIW